MTVSLPGGTMRRLLVLLLLALAAFPLAGRPAVVWGQAAQHRLVSVTGFKHAGANGVRVDLTLDVPPSADADAIARDALARQGAQPLADSTSADLCLLLTPRWPQFFDHGQQHPVVPQYYNPAGDPTAGGALAALQSAEQAWSSVPTSRFALQYAGTTTAGAASVGINMVGWTTQAIIGDSTLAETFTTYSCTTGFILDADMLINANDQWFTNPSDLTPTSFDLGFVLLHENGHVAGLGHSHDPTAVMWPIFFPGIVGHGLAQDDINAISSRYPLQFKLLPAFSAAYRGSSAFMGLQAFSAAYSGSIAFTGPASATYTGSGTGTYVGTSQVQGTLQVFSGAVSCPGTGFNTRHNDTITAANGDSLSVMIAAVACETPPGSQVYQSEGTYVITGGTGRFSGASGQGTVVGQADFTTHTFSLSFSGSIALSAAYSGSGTGTDVGASQVQGTIQLIPGVLPGAVSCPGTGFITQDNDTITAANGDSLSVVIFAIACETPPGSQMYQSEGIYQITGGTGRFSGAIGVGTVVGQDDFTTHTFSLTFSGTGS
jgi:hypothetical protein